MQSFNYKGGKLQYNVLGEGDPIVLIHGFAMDNRMWEKQVKSLVKEGKKVVTYDMRGFGESSVPTEAYSHEDDLKALLDHLKLEEVHIVGMSFGAEVASGFAFSNKNVVKSLTLISPSLRGYVPKEKSPLERWGNMVKGGKGDYVRKEMMGYSALESLKENPENMRIIKQMIDSYSLWHLDHDDLSEPTRYENELVNITCPTKVIVGENDSEDQKEIFEKLKIGIPNIEVQEVLEAGHFIPIEDPEVVSEAISEHVKKNEASAEVNAGMKLS